jgi:wyosine [tRNA(Phe)-imidazoG37] synthetase (radical SAM superfamily)
MAYRYLFGPVPSRRLGISLGIDLVPHKTCLFNCVYCECGRTTNLTCERREYVPTNEVIAELDEFLATAPDLDYVTFAGSGEPTLHSGIGEIISFIKDRYPRYRVAGRGADQQRALHRPGCPGRSHAGRPRGAVA